MEKVNVFFWPLIILGVLFIISFFLSASETALIALSKIRLRRLVDQGTKNAKVVHKLVSRLDRLITTILVGNNVVNIGISVIFTAIFIYFFGQKMGMIVSTVVVSVLILVFVEITPKLFAAQYPEKVSLMVARPINVLIIIFRPIAGIFVAAGNFLIRLFGGELRNRAPLITEEEMRVMIEVGKEEGAISDEERKMLHRIFEFGDTQVGEVMIPKDKVVAIEVNASPEELLSLFIKEGHSRVPVYRDSIENIIGIVYARDILTLYHNKEAVTIASLMQPAYFIGADNKVNELLKNFQRMRIQIAIVVDEYKKAQGIATLEDLLEEIVGEIEEEEH